MGKGKTREGEDVSLHCATIGIPVIDKRSLKAVQYPPFGQPWSLTASFYDGHAHVCSTGGTLLSNVNFLKCSDLHSFIFASLVPIAPLWCNVAAFIGSLSPFFLNHFLTSHPPPSFWCFRVYAGTLGLAV